MRACVPCQVPAVPGARPCRVTDHGARTNVRPGVTRSTAGGAADRAQPRPDARSRDTPAPEAAALSQLTTLETMLAAVIHAACCRFCHRLCASMPAWKRGGKGWGSVSLADTRQGRSPRHERQLTSLQCTQCCARSKRCCPVMQAAAIARTPHSFIRPSTLVRAACSSQAPA